MKSIASALLVVLLSFSLAIPAGAAPLTAIPTFSILNIQPGHSITILTYNFPAHHAFDVLMGEIGTRGIGGAHAATIQTGAGGSFHSTILLPAAVRGLYQVAVRLQSQSNPAIFAYNWFYNDGASGPYIDPPPGAPLPSGKPAPFITISGAARNVSVSITTHNFPLSHKFNVLMGPMGSRGINGTLTQTITTGNASSETFTLTIPPAFHNTNQIAIRLESANGTSGFFAYSWFNNDTFGNVGGPISGPVPPAHHGTGKIHPTFRINAVTRNSSVTILTFNLPANKVFQVTMGALGTRGIGGPWVDSFDSGSGGTQALTFSIPAVLHGLPEIAIRIQATDGSGYYAYNWFYNTNAR